MYGGDIYVGGEIEVMGRMWNFIKGGRRIFNRGELVFDK
jgi:hypothetical protein